MKKPDRSNTHTHTHTPHNSQPEIAKAGKLHTTIHCSLWLSFQWRTIPSSPLAYFLYSMCRDTFSYSGARVANKHHKCFSSIAILTCGRMLSLATGLHTIHYLPDRLRYSKRDQLQVVSHKDEEIKVNLLLKFFQTYGEKCILESFL